MKLARLVPRRFRPAVARLGQIERQLRLPEAFFVLAILGWALASDTLALLGCIGALGSGVLLAWQRYCLAGVAYRRRLASNRVRFGERVVLELEIVNDKPLPLAFLEIDDEVPAGIPIEGGSLTPVFHQGRAQRLVQVLSLFPYQRVRRRLVVVCDRRGDHTFGPATLTSGDPIGWRTRNESLATIDHLLVLPKLFELEPAGIASKVLLGEQRSRAQLLGDPSRVAGVRPYQPGDPLRHVNWRATARTGELLVRRFEPTVSPKVAIFLDVFIPMATSGPAGADELEFTVSVAASLVNELAARRIPVGLFSTGTAAGRPVAHPPSGAANALGAMLESLAKVVAFGSFSIDRLLLAATARMAPQTSVVVVAADFAGPLLTAVAHVRRRQATSALFVAGPAGSTGRPPRPEYFDAVLGTPYVADWKTRSSVELAVPSAIVGLMA